MRPVDPRLLHHASAARRHVAWCTGAGLAATAGVLVQAELLTTAVTRAVDGRGVRAVAGLLVGLVGVTAVRAVLAWAQEVTGQRAAARVKVELRTAVVAAAAGGSGAGAPERAEASMLATRGLDALDPYLARYLPQLVLAVVVPVAVIARLALADPTAAVIVAVTLPLVPLFMVLVGRATEAANRRRWRALARLSHHVLDVVTGLPTLRAFGRGDAQVDSVRASTERYRRTTMATLRISFLSSLTLELLATLSVALVAVSVGLRLVDGRLGLRTGLLAIVLAPEAYLPLRQLGAQYHASAEGLAAAGAALDLIEHADASTAGTAAPELRRGALVLDDVEFVHGDRGVVAPAGVSLSVRPGEVVAVVGPSGSGKSTLARLVLGFERPSRGAVTLVADGAAEAVADVDPPAWHAQVAWVPQAPYLCAGTVADNVRIGRADATEADVAAVLETVGLGAMASGRTVGEGGRGLSTGERRRVVLARALVRDAALLVLDEPTAGLDAGTEADVLRAVRRGGSGCAVLLFTHRPAAVAAADRTVVLPPARVAELAVAAS